MGIAAQFRMLSGYNAWANERILDACAGLEDAEYHKNRQAFFGSIHGTLNHILLVQKLTIDHIIVFDERWAEHWAGRDHEITALDQILHDRLAPLATDQSAEDQLVVSLMTGYHDSDLDRDFTWLGLSGAQRWLYMPHALENFFLHQTHHRGQVHNMLSQAGVDPPPLDLYVFIEEERDGE